MTVTATNIIMANEGHNRLVITWATYDEFSSKFNTDPGNTVNSEDFLHYEIYRTDLPTPTLAGAALMETIGRREVRRWSDNTAIEGQQYFYTVVWCNRDGTREQWEWRGPYRWARPKHPSALTSDYDVALGGKSVILSWTPPITESDSITPLIPFVTLSGYRLFWKISTGEEEVDWTYDVGGYGSGYEDRDGSGKSDGYGIGTDVLYYTNFVDVSLSDLQNDIQGIGATVGTPKYKFSPLSMGKKYLFNVKAYDNTNELLDRGDETLQACVEIAFDAASYTVSMGGTAVVEANIINCGIDLQEAYIEYRITIRSYGYGEDISTRLLHNSESGSDTALAVGSNKFDIPINIGDTGYDDYYGGNAYGYGDIGEYELCVLVYEDSTKTNLLTAACVNIIPEGE